MLPAVLIDMGVDAPQAQVQWVVQACNEVVVEGTCEPLSPGAVDVPVAVAVVRSASARNARVSIQMQLPRSDAPLTVRRFVFSRADPRRERWRSVGFAIGILTGRVQRGGAAALQREAEAFASSEPEPHEVSGPLGAPAPDQPAPLPELPPNPAPPQGKPESAVDELPEASAREDWPPPVGLHLTAGVVAESGRSVLPTPRGGGAFAAGWVFQPGWLLRVGAQYVVAEQETLSYRRAVLTAGVGYRLRLAADWSVLGVLGAGVRRSALSLRVPESLQAAPGQQTDRGWLWRPAGEVEVKLSWRPWERTSVWAAFQLQTGFSRTEVVDEQTGRVARFEPFLQPVAALGWSLWL